ncbi:hypothetical protein JNW90_04925 [Micromonospora sp. STR1s_5]|nr:hypothetical protein [Micromonospora sp. STR1s_5]
MRKATVNSGHLLDVPDGRAAQFKPVVAERLSSVSTLPYPACPCSQPYSQDHPLKTTPPDNGRRADQGNIYLTSHSRSSSNPEVAQGGVVP